MTITEALHHATQGGYHIKASDGMDTVYAGANSEYSVWTRTDNDSSFIVPVADSFLDPHFWQALGCGLGWDQAVKTARAVENGTATLVTRTGHPWVSSWHHFIDYLVEGKTAEDFFERVPCPATRERDKAGRRTGTPTTRGRDDKRRALSHR
jgi:hypothetical protein